MGATQGHVLNTPSSQWVSVEWARSAIRAGVRIGWLAVAMVILSQAWLYAQTTPPAGPVFVFAVAREATDPNKRADDAGVARFGREVAEAVMREMGGRLEVREYVEREELQRWMREEKAGFFLGLVNPRNLPAGLEASSPVLPMTLKIHALENRMDITGVDGLEGMRVICPQENAPLMREGGLPLHQCDTVPQVEDGIAELLSHRADALISSEILTHQAINRMNISGHIRDVGEPLGVLHWAFMVAGGNAETLAYLNEGLTRIKANGTYGRIHSRYFDVGVLSGYNTAERITAMVFVSLAVPLLVLVVVCMFLIIRYRKDKLRLKLTLDRQLRIEEELRISQEQIRSVLDNTPVPVCITRVEQGTLLYGNKKYAELLKIPADALLNWPVHTLHPSPEQRGGLMHRVARDGIVEDAEITINTTEGSPLSLLVSLQDFQFMGEKAVLVAHHDITAKKQLESNLARQSAFVSMQSQIAVLANQSVNSTEVYQFALQVICEYKGWPIGHVFLPSDLEDELVPSGIWYLKDRSAYQEFRKVTSEITFHPGEGLPGRVYESGKPAWIENIFKDNNFPRAGKLVKQEVVSGFAFPVLVNNKVVAVLEFFSPSQEAPDAVFLDYIANIGAILGRVTERNTAAEALKDSQVSLALAQKMVHLGSWDLNVQKQTMTWSEETFRIFGVDPSEGQASAALFVSFAHPGDRFKLDDMLCTNDESCGPRSFEYRIVRGDGEIRYIKTQSEVIRGAMDSVIHIFGYVFDITESKKAEEELRRNQLLVNTVLNNLPHAVVAKDTAGRYLIVNETFEKMYGLSNAEVIGKSSDQLLALPGEARERISRQDHSVLQEGLVLDEEVEVQGADGEIQIHHHIKQPLIDEHGQIEGMVGISQDVTAIRNSEQKLKHSEARFRSLVEGSIEGIAVQSNREIVFANESAAKMFGYHTTDAFFALRSIDNIIAPEDRERLQGFDATRRAGGEAPNSYVFKGIRADGSTVWINNMVSLVDWDGQKAILNTMHDVTEHYSLEEQLRQAQKMESVGQLAGGVAHDFNNHLQVIMGQVELALHKDPSENMKRYLEPIYKAGASASALTRQLLAFSRKEVLKVESADVNDLIRQDGKILNRLIGENIELELRLMNEAGWVMVDKGMVGQVLMNLCINSRDAMPDGGRLIIETNLFDCDAEFAKSHTYLEEGAYVRMSVSDTGMGMPPEVRKRIFEPFYTTKERHKGTGLGLSTVYGIVKQHGGAIDVYSEVGVGTTFNIYLPLDEGYQGRPAVAAPREAEAPAPGKGETVLVAEDEESVREVLRTTLEESGYQVLAVGDGQDALDILKAHRQDIGLVILDMIMPSLSGRDVFEKMKSLELDVPVIFSTGYTAEIMDTEFFSKNNVPLMRKPYALDDLLALVKENIRQPYSEVMGA